MSYSEAARRFRERYIEGLLTHSFAFQQNNWASYRFGPEGDKRADIFQLGQFVAFVLDNLDGLTETESVLEDVTSRDILHELLLFRSLSHHHVRMRRNTPEYQQFAASADSHPDGAKIITPRVRPMGHKFMHEYFVHELNCAVLATNGLPINVLFNGQYLFERDGIQVKPLPGDVVLDCGACWGDTSVLFAALVGDAGQVHAFEFVPDNLALLEENRLLNPEMRERIIVARYPVSDQSGQELRFTPQGPGTRLGAEGSMTAHTISIDDYVAQAGLSKVNFIKMDIEGSEEAALIGARNTIRRFQPRLAISVYHKPSDLVLLPRLIRELLPEYSLYLDHHTIHAEETVLYACRK